jgi:hypothetical protein
LQWIRAAHIKGVPRARRIQIATVRAAVVVLFLALIADFNRAAGIAGAAFAASASGAVAFAEATISAGTFPVAVTFFTGACIARCRIFR